MSKHAYVVTVPKPHHTAYNPDRPISDLVKNQILHLSVAEQHLDTHHQSGKDVHSIKTEREASEYIAHLTRKLHAKETKKPQTAKKNKPARPRPARPSSKTNRRKKK
ncbi:MAG TPA: hypothetical protein VK525_06230 [Candidatus Saccharimonadales bacterium]|nr:hypothetical protein [Candidatus Saccharimonadales bacterium]